MPFMPPMMRFNKLRQRVHLFLRKNVLQDKIARLVVRLDLLQGNGWNHTVGFLSENVESVCDIIEVQVIRLTLCSLKVAEMRSNLDWIRRLVSTEFPMCQ